MCFRSLFIGMGFAMAPQKSRFCLNLAPEWSFQKESFASHSYAKRYLNSGEKLIQSTSLKSIDYRLKKIRELVKAEASPPLLSLASFHPPTPHQAPPPYPLRTDSLEANQMTTFAAVWNAPPGLARPRFRRPHVRARVPGAALAGLRVGMVIEDIREKLKKLLSQSQAEKKICIRERIFILTVK